MTVRDVKVTVRDAGVSAEPRHVVIKVWPAILKPLNADRNVYIAGPDSKHGCWNPAGSTRHDAVC